jgi:hypothetical protein
VWPTPPSKKQALLAITEKYLPDNYIILQKYDDATINMLAEGDSLEDFVMSYPTIIHEGFHVFEISINWLGDSLRKYRLDDTTTIAVRKFHSFPAKALNAIVPDSLQTEIFRYGTYINSKDLNMDTQQNGFLGILEEFAAYYQGLKAYCSTYYFLKDSFAWSKPKIWLKYLSNEGSEIYAINEFKLFISWYLQYARKRMPDIYEHIRTDENIKKMYAQIDSNSKTLIETFLKNRDNILMRIKKFTTTSNGFSQLKGPNEWGYGIDDHLKMLRFTEQLLADPKNSILMVLRQ